jgi:hypothetical protein
MKKNIIALLIASTTLITGCDLGHSPDNASAATPAAAPISGTTAETITFKGVPFDTPNIKEALQKICREDTYNAKSEYSQDKCLFENPTNIIKLNYGILNTVGDITLDNNGSLIKVEFLGSKIEILAQVETLSSKYGTPIKTVTQVANKLGTKFDKETFTWTDNLGTRITAESMYSKVDDGRLVIQSAQSIKNEEEATKTLENAAKNNL